MRTVIELPAEQVAGLAELCEREGISRAEAIRRAVASYLAEQMAETAGEAFALWKGRDVDALEYERELRDEWEEPCEPSSTPTSSSTT